MVSTEVEEARARQALLKVQDAGRDLEAARVHLVLRAQVAIAAGADDQSIAQAAGVSVHTLRSWLTGRTPHAPVSL